MPEHRDVVTEMIERLLEVLDPILGPDLTIFTTDGPEGVEVTIEAVVADPAAVLPAAR